MFKMNRYTKLTNTVSLVTLMAMTAVPAMAQEAGPAEEEVSLDEVVVTGSYIKGLKTDGAIRALKLDRTDILESGANSVIDLLRDLTVTGGGAGTFSTSTGGALSGQTPAGAAAVSLRGLSSSATLTLINGRRASIASFANGQESFIDVNSIPLAAIERVEVLADGASATYGADAVAGVINYILRDDYEGFEMSASYGNTTRGTNDGRFNINAVGGFKTDRHHFMIIADYYKREPLFDRDREITRNSVRPSQQGFFPSFNDLFLQLNDQTEEPQDAGCAAEDFRTGPFGEFCQVNTNAFTATDDEFESIGGIFTHRFEISDDLTWFTEVMYQHTDGRGTSSPANFSRAPIDPENPNWPAALQEDIIDEGGAFDFTDFFGFPIFAWGKFLDPRSVEVTSDTLRIVTGFDYDISEDWNVEAAVTYGQNKSTQRGSGLILAENFYNSTLGNLCSDGSTVARWDVDVERPSASFNGGPTCEDNGLTTLWYNPFGGQTVQPDGLAELINTDAERNGTSKLWIADAVASGNLFELGDNFVQAAFGVEYRYESLNDTPAGVAVGTLDNPSPILGFSSTSALATRNNYAVFAEVNVPLTDELNVLLAGRFEDSDDYDSDFNPKVTVSYSPIEELLFRANYSTSFRAPSLAESGAGTRLAFTTVDCEMVPAACDGDAGADGEQLFSEEVSNPELQPETARTFGFGTLIRPNKDIEFSIDYWNIRYENLIDIDEDDFLRRALAGEFGPGTVIDTNATDPGVPTTLPTGQVGVEVTDGFVTDAHFALTNLGFQKTSGIDARYRQYFELGNVGTLRFTTDVTYLIEFDSQASINAPIIEEAGKFRFPKWLITSQLRWRNEAWRVSVTGRYTSSFEDEPTNRVRDVLLDQGIISDFDEEIRVDSWFTVDANVSYDFTEDTFVSLNIRNVFDQDPPIAYGTGANVDHINHDSLGRLITLRVNHRF